MNSFVGNLKVRFVMEQKVEEFHDLKPNPKK